MQITKLTRYERNFGFLIAGSYLAHISIFVYLILNNMFFTHGIHGLILSSAICIMAILLTRVIDIEPKEEKIEDIKYYNYGYFVPITVGCSIILVLTAYLLVT